MFAKEGPRGPSFSLPGGTGTMADMDAPLVELRALGKRYGRREAVRDISLSLHRGEIVGLLGPNGAGKSTLIGMLTGLLAPSAGEILWEGRRITECRAAWRRTLGVVLEDLSLFEYLTVRENIELVATLYGLPAAEISARSASLLDFLDLEPHAGTPAAEASQGTRRKLAFALAILHAPRILLLDEALNGIDALTAARIKGLLRRAAASGVTVVLSSHVLDAVESVVDRCVIVHRGVVVLDAPMVEIRAGGRTLEQVYTAAVAGDAPAVVLPWIGG
jgi:ABC-2 type transport system ATP-binding protein